MVLNKIKKIHITKDESMGSESMGSEDLMVLIILDL